MPNLPATTDTSDERAEYIAGLRALADLLERNPDLDLPTYGKWSWSPIRVVITRDDGQRQRDQLAAWARALPGEKTKAPAGQDGEMLTLAGRLRGIWIDVLADRDEVCERVVIGTHEVTKEIPDPDAPTVTVTEIVEDVRWECKPAAPGGCAVTAPGRHRAPDQPARTQDEILARFQAIGDTDDYFGFRRDLLIACLDYDHAKPYLKESTTPEQWAEAHVTGDRSIEDDAHGYLEFAIGKILDHRGISATRSVDKLAEYAWLLGRDDIVSAMNNEPYEQYGAPKVKVFAEGMGWSWPDDPVLARMSAGLPCTDGCDSGCGR